MAANVTGVLTVTPSGVPVGGEVTVTLVLTNSGDVDAVITDVTPTASALGQTSNAVACALGRPLLGYTGLIVGKNSGTATVSWTVSPQAVAPKFSLTEFCWTTIGCNILLSTGVQVYPTGVAVACTTLPYVLKAGLLDFSQFENSGMIPAMI